MARRSAVLMPTNKSTLSGNARPFIPSGLQQSSSSFSFSSSSSPPSHPPPPFPFPTRNTAERRARYVHHSRPVPVNLPLESIAQAVSDNNAFLLGKNILTAYGNLDVYRTEQDLGRVRMIEDAMATALRKHPDPPMFIVNALITIGTVAIIKDVDSDFELAISELLINVMEQYAEWYHEHPDERAAALKLASISSSAKRGPTPAVVSGFHIEPLISQENQVDDLIMLDEQPIFKRSSPIVSLPQIPYVGSSPAFNLLDDDDDHVDTPNLFQMALLKPFIPDLINLSISDEPGNDSSTPGPSIVTTTPMLSSSDSSVSISTLRSDRDEELLLTDDSELEQDDVIVEVGLHQLDKARQLVLDRRGPQAILPSRKQVDIESDFEDLLDVFDNRRHNNESEPSDADNAKAAEELQDNDTSLIQQRHRDKLLQEILGGKHALQVYSAIDVLEMQADLLKPAANNNNNNDDDDDKDKDKDRTEETYGWILARELYKRERFRESTVVIFEYLQAHRNPTFSDDAPPPLPPSCSILKSSPLSCMKNPSGAYGWKQAGPWSPSPWSPAPAPKMMMIEAVQPSLPPGPSMETSGPLVPLYELPSTTNVVFVDSEAQLRTLSVSLGNSKVVGMDTEWLPQIGVYEEYPPVYSKTAIMQLACDADSTVYIVDTIAFLQNVDSVLSLVQVIGDTFNNPKILKIAYDWDGDQERLLATFPALFQERYRPREFLDLKHVWFKSLQDHLFHHPPGTTTTTTTTTTRAIEDTLSSDSPSSPVSSSSPSTSLPPPTGEGPGPEAGPEAGAGVGAGAGAGAVIVPGPGGFVQWSHYPSAKGMRTIPGGLSGMLTKLCGKKLDKSQQCSHWEQRPLTEKQLLYAAVDAWCLLDIYQDLEIIKELEKSWISL